MTATDCAEKVPADLFLFVFLLSSLTFLSIRSQHDQS